MVVFWFQNGTVLGMARTVTLKNIPDKVYQDLKDRAKENHRSLNGEILHALQNYLTHKNINEDPETFISRLRKFREKVKGQLTAEEIDKAINEERP